MRTLRFGPLFGLETTVAPAALAWFGGLAPVSAALAGWLLGLGLLSALSAGLLSAVVFFASEWLHQAGHALAARRVGHPMRGMHYFSIFSASVYPPDEPPLPRRVHVLRSLGGFWVNLLLGGVLALLALPAWPNGGVGAWLLAFGAVVNVFVLGLGALLPLKVPGGDGLTDGGALLRMWKERMKDEG